MLFEKPVVVSSAAGVSEVLDGEDVAVIVPPKNPRELAMVSLGSGDLACSKDAPEAATGFGVRLTPKDKQTWAD